ncbi:UNVERIFIED_CONTAM: hypothetical protein FKN15_062807 [Acipenser sinensis]
MVGGGTGTTGTAGGRWDGYFCLVEASTWCPSCGEWGHSVINCPPSRRGGGGRPTSVLEVMNMFPACGEWGHFVVNCPLLQDEEKEHQFLAREGEAQSPEIGDYLLLLPPVLETDYHHPGLEADYEPALPGEACTSPPGKACSSSPRARGRLRACTAREGLLVITQGFVVSSSSICTSGNPGAGAQKKELVAAREGLLVITQG